MMERQHPKALSLKEVAKDLGITEQTARQLLAEVGMQRPDLKGIKIGKTVVCTEETIAVMRAFLGQEAPNIFALDSERAGRQPLRRRARKSGRSWWNFLRLNSKVLLVWWTFIVSVFSILGTLGAILPRSAGPPPGSYYSRTGTAITMPESQNRRSPATPAEADAKQPQAESENSAKDTAPVEEKSGPPPPEHV